MNIKIGELAKRTDCSIQTIRFYEKEGVLPAPTRSDGNYRLYNEDHIERLRFIRHCRMLDMTLSDVSTLIKYRDTPNTGCEEVNVFLDQHIDAVQTRLEELAQLKLHLLTLRRQCNQPVSAASCGILRALSDCSCHTN